mgnify:CR=1 FL=1
MKSAGFRILSVVLAIVISSLIVYALSHAGKETKGPIENAMTATDYDFEAETADFEGAEDFLAYFQVPFDASVVHVNRLHILQRFHDYLAVQVTPGTSDYADYRQWMVRAYEDFVKSDARTEKVFRVLQRASGIAKVSVSSIGRTRR